MRLLVLFLPIVLALAGCEGRSIVALVPDAIGSGTTEPVLVASTRHFEDGEFVSERLEGLSFVRFDVNVPPGRSIGEVVPSRARNIDPNEQFVVTRAEDLGGPDGFRQTLRARLDEIPGTPREVMVFVHGFNSTFADGLYRTAQIRHDYDIPVAAVHYAWPSAGNPLGYAFDRDSALFARDGLERLLIEIAEAGNTRILLVAHSLGSGLTMEALRALRIGGRQDVLDRFSGIVLMSPDIDVDVFRSQALRIDPLPQPFLIFVSRRDRALLLSATITGQRQRLGNIGTLEDVVGLNVTLIDVTEFEGGDGDGLNHFTAASSPALVQLLQQAGAVNTVLGGDVIQRLGLISGTILTIRGATDIILQPFEDVISGN